MSMVSQALLIVLERVLENRTWAEDRVWQQPIDPLADMMQPGSSAGKPVIAIYSEMSEGEPVGLETQRGSQEITLKIMGYIAPSVTRVKENTVEIEMDAKGAGMALNFLGRQIEVALHTGNDAWLRLWRGFCLRINGRKSRYVLIEIEGGLRVPCLEIELKLTTVAEPEIGRALYGYWKQLDTKLREGSNGEAVALADMLKALIEGPADMPAWKQFQATTNLTDSAYVASGLGALAYDEDGPVQFGSAEFEAAEDEA